MMFLQSLLLLIMLCCSTQAATTMRPDQSSHESTETCACSPLDLQPLLSAMGIDHSQAVQWRADVLALLSQLVSVQKEISGGQAEMSKLLGTLGAQGAQQILDTQNLARHQSLLVENHQALLLQLSRITTQLQDMAKNAASVSQ